MLVLPFGPNAVRAAPPANEFGVAAGFVTVVVGCLAATCLYAPGADTGRLLVLTVVIAGFAAMIQDALAALVTAGLAWPFYLGFLVDRYGELRWHGSVDLLRLAALVAASLLGTALGWITHGASVRPRSGSALQLGEMHELGHRRATRAARGGATRGGVATMHARRAGRPVIGERNGARDRRTWLT